MCSNRTGVTDWIVKSGARILEVVGRLNLITLERVLINFSACVSKLSLKASSCAMDKGGAMDLISLTGSFIGGGVRL
jgi:hypothetical protein